MPRALPAYVPACFDLLGVEAIYMKDTFKILELLLEYQYT